ncbi:MAG: component of SufBCD complex [Rhodobacteraceae bacterium]|nr:component of SufBCD complex [Paracoccaceae bacterium]
MDWYKTVFELIDMRSFSNLWFWIALAVVWSTTSHWVLGVPFDMLQRARRSGGQAEADFEDMVRINVNRLLHISEVSGLWILTIGSGILTALVILGFWYEVEIAQALFLMGLPMSIVGLLSLRTARIIRRTNILGEPLRKRMVRHRLWTQVIGMIAIFVTAMWGMYQNLSIGVLGG